MIDFELDHLGIIVKSIDKELEIYKALGYSVECGIFQDNTQGMRGLFLNSPFNDCRIELIEDLSESKALSKMLNTRCGRIYHLAFKVKNLEEQIEEILKQLNARILSPIKNAEYYAKVCFLFLPNAQIIELVEYKC